MGKPKGVEKVRVEMRLEPETVEIAKDLASKQGFESIRHWAAALVRRAVHQAETKKGAQ